eukprot:TRINITY_DN2358_c0_g1_i3.p1 TRINITY_DN2358_c0_g1~~TRINITY_DN2358_c0_g1_i3.p1  ORF type:complete len:254 (-),score=27.61 TRINITY_DN2358_c0_g1_i3:49-810(-)
MATSKLVRILASIFGSIVGGFIGDRIGFTVLIPFSIILLIISVYPLLSLDNVENSQQDESSIVQNITNRNKIIDSLCLMAYGFQKPFSYTFWPLYLKRHFTERYAVVGLDQSLNLIFAFLMVSYISKYIDEQRKLSLVFSMLFHSLIWLVRMCINDITQATITSMIFGITESFSNICFFAYNYDKADVRGIESHLILQESSISFGNAIGWMVMYAHGDTFFSGGSMFIVAIVGTLAQIPFCFTGTPKQSVKNS